MKLGALSVSLQTHTVQFSEANGSWQVVPHWAGFLFNCGLTFGAMTGVRRVSLLSMPCESAAAGLVTLGAMCRRLAMDDAHDSRAHFHRIERLAMEHEIPTLLRHETYTGRFQLERRGPAGFIWVRSETAGGAGSTFRNKVTRIAILPANANAWRLDGEAPVQAVQGAELSHSPLYEELLGNACKPLRSNFARSDSGICYAGRLAGESVSKSMLQKIRLQTTDCEADLARLLTVHRWSPGTISRVTFFNTRTGEFDRNTGLTRLVIADGDASFLKVIEAPEFRQSDVVAVLHRAVDRERLEAVGFKVADLAQWYAPDTELPEHLPQIPSGITILTLRRR